MAGRFTAEIASQFAGVRIRQALRSSLLCAFVLAAASCARDAQTLKREHLDRGNRLIADRKPFDAIIEYRIAAQIDPASGEVRKKLGQAYLEVQDNAHALDEFVRAADLLPGDVDVQLTAGISFSAPGASKTADLAP